MTLLTHTVFHSIVHGEVGVITIPYKSCAHNGKSHTIAIQGDSFMPDKLVGNRCDIVTFINNDQHAVYLPSFGDHPHDLHYAGFPDKVLGYNQKESFVAHTEGTFTFHDHLKDQIDGLLIIK